MIYKEEINSFFISEYGEIKDIFLLLNIVRLVMFIDLVGNLE